MNTTRILKRQVVKLIDRLGTSFGGDFDWSDAGLMNEARRVTGLSDWGGEEFREPLKVLLECVAVQEPRMDYAWKYSLRRFLLKRLVNRLLIQADIKRHPEIRRVRIRRPVVVTGIPRSGTTLLHRLLAQDPAARTFQLWELMAPSPPPKRLTYQNDPRRKLSIPNRLRRLASRAISDREVQAKHHSDLGEPEECLWLLANSFFSRLFRLLFGIYDQRYFDLLQDNGHSVNAYRYYRRQLQLLSWRCPGDRMVVKSPAHLLYLDALLGVFPDARVVWNHRDIHQVVPSMCSLKTSFIKYRGSRRQVGPSEIGRWTLDTVAVMLEKATAARAAADPARFLDLDYNDIVADPIGAVRRIYDFAGDRLTVEAERKMTKWLAAHPRNKFGSHKYDLETFGLRASDIDDRISGYRSRYEPGADRDWGRDTRREH